MMKEETHLEIYGGLRGDIGIKMYMHGPMDCSKKLKLRFRLGDESFHGSPPNFSLTLKRIAGWGGGAIVESAGPGPTRKKKEIY